MSSRRGHVPFDPRHFEKEADRGAVFSRQDTFRRIYRANHWAGKDSVSGEGSGRSQTQQIERDLPLLLLELNVRTLLDIPCGDFGWMQRVDLPVAAYIGGDIVPELIAQNQAQYGSKQQRFVVLDLVKDPLPEADLLFCRDCLVHQSFADIFQALTNIQKGQITYLLTTTFPACEANEDIITGDWRVLNLEKPPFHFPPPLRLLNEGCTEGGGLFEDKSLGLWKVQDLPHAFDQ
jgi:hypothetical protein